MNSITVAGVLTNLQSSSTANGTPVLKFSIADNYKRGGEKKVNWWNCAVFGKRADSLNWLTEKAKVAVRGHIEQNKSGEKTYYNLTVDDLDVLYMESDSNSSSGGPKAQSKPEPQSDGGFDDDIPF